MRYLRVAGAVLLSAAMIVYAAAWTYYTQQNPGAFLGIVSDYDGWARHLDVRRVVPGSPAERAGLEAEDHIVAVNGVPLESPAPFSDAVVRGRPGQVVRLTLSREGTPDRFDVDAILGVGPDRSPAHSGAQRVALSPLLLYPIPAVIVGVIVLALRAHDGNAWLLALIFAGIGTGPLQTVESLSHPSLRGFLVAYSALFSGLMPALFYTLLARFPVASARDRRVPWLKTLMVVLATVFFVPYATWIFMAGSVWPFVRVLTPAGVVIVDRTILAYFFVGIALGFVSLLLNCRAGVEATARRKARLLGWSFAIGLLPWMGLLAATRYLKRDLFELPFWAWVPCSLLMMLVPVLFGYAVVKHRVLEFSVLVRRSARYVLVQRGFVLLSLVLSLAVTALFVTTISRVLPRLTDAALPTGIAAGTLFGLALVRTGGAVATRVTRRIDRAFFRSAYDARRVLEELAQQAGSVQDRDELAALIDGQLKEALHPCQLAIYLRDRAGLLQAFGPCPSDSPPVLEVPQALLRQFESDPRPSGAPPEVRALPLRRVADAECLVPMLSRRRQLVGLLLLGPRLSDEPYSSEDKALLASMAGHAGGALENLMLAEQMAERIEAERRAAQEVQIAAEVQRRLLPVKTTTMATVEFIGRCVQARSVGGDYYDFLDLGRGRLGLVLADVSGKGLYAALLMAHLQASVRSLAGRVASEDLVDLLGSLNRSFAESTAGNHFATLFFGLYDDDQRRLRYANCGHQPPFLLRASGVVERLPVTAGAVGFFVDWACATAEVAIAPGDLLVLFSDGVTEAMSPGGDEFGESRLLEALTAERHGPLNEVVDRVVTAVRAFGGVEQSDDLTLVIVRAH